MIINTTNSEQNGQALGPLYDPRPSRYHFPEYKDWMNGRYHWLLKSDGLYLNDGNELEHLLNQRNNLIDSKVHLLHEELYHRHWLKDDNLYRINLDQCFCRSLIYVLGDHVFDKRRIELERKIIYLEEEKRREATNYFRDVLFIRKELRDTLIERLEEQQKAALFINQPEALP